MKKNGFTVILVEPKYGGNIGSVARVMKNFGFRELYLVNPCSFDDECYQRAMHAVDVLEDAKIYSSFEEATKNMDLLVATSAISTYSEKNYLRNPIYLPEFSEKIYEIQGKIGLVFGREDYGLYNEEIKKCDLLLKIPTSDEYPSMNLSHAVAIVLYHLYVQKFTPIKPRIIDRVEKEYLYRFFSDLLDLIDYPEHKKDKTKTMFTRVMSRAMPSKWEYHTLMGVLAKTLEKLKDK
ncbi:MAG TPA: RNA methyltransferase [Thermoplasmatales archaeon]|nr:RNA methyltransferase [Thermoplasmatales archaeon]